MLNTHHLPTYPSHANAYVGGSYGAAPHVQPAYGHGYPRMADSPQAHPPYAQPASAQGPSALGTYPVAGYQAVPVQRQMPVAAPVPEVSSLTRSIRMGYELYSALSPQEQQDIHTRGRKPRSVRRMAQERGVPASTMWRALAIYLLFQRYPELGSYRHVGVAHLSVILGARPENQLYFLRMVELERWSRRKLDLQVKRCYSRIGN